ncbi:hypothetical protein ABZP36_004360, partial [Zizania latifolia]
KDCDQGAREVRQVQVQSSRCGRHNARSGIHGDRRRGQEPAGGGRRRCGLRRANEMPEKEVVRRRVPKGGGGQFRKAETEACP